MVAVAMGFSVSGRVAAREMLLAPAWRVLLPAKVSVPPVAPGPRRR